jgi:xanthine dehydrogenase molybdenum-binding subunit
MMEHCGYCHENVRTIQIVINRDGSAVIHSGTQEIGQGINTTLRMLAAESLGISLEDVAIITGDTRTGQYDLIAAKASSQLATEGHLLLKAIEEAKQKIRKIVAPALQTSPEKIEISGKQAYIKGQPEAAKPLRDLLSTAVTGVASGTPDSSLPDVKPGFRPYQPVAIAAEVEVDIETGVVTPIKLVPAMFPGRMINPGVVRGQSIGGAIMTLGMALWEEFNYEETTSIYLSRDFTDYKIPRALDIPEVETVLLQEVDETSSPHEGLPYGARGIGELSCWGGPAVIANAIYNAIGVRIRRSPITAEAVLHALAKEAIK